MLLRSRRKVCSFEAGTSTLKKRNKANLISDEFSGLEDCKEQLDCVRAKFKGSLVGAHCSIAKGVQNAVLHAARIRATAFAMDLKNKRRWNSPPISQEDAARFIELCRYFGYSTNSIVPHASYLINLGSPDEDVLRKSKDCLMDELRRCSALNLVQIVLHPGSGCGKISKEECCQRIAEALDWVFDEMDKERNSVMILLENMAGQGNCIGANFEQIRSIIDLVGTRHRHRIGVCLDTAHLHGAGIDIRTKKGIDSVLKQFDGIAGMERLRAIHLNDSKADIGSRRDLHENIGKGKIGTDCFRVIMNHSELLKVPMILETPFSEEIYIKELQLLRSFIETDRFN